MRILKYLVLLYCFTATGAETPNDESAGIGVALGAEGQDLVVKHIFPDSPAAAQKDIHVGDRILAIAQDREPAVPLPGGKLSQAISLIRGGKGTTVRLTVVAAGEDESRARVVSFVRGKIGELARWGDGVLLTKGVKAPDTAMTGLGNGKTERLADYAGKIVVLEFWATYCAPCQPQMAELQTYPAKYPDWKDQVIVIAVSVDDNQETATKHVQTKGWNQTHNVWVDIDAKKAWHVNGIPTVYVIDRQGRVVAANPEDLPETVNRTVQSRSDIEPK